ncbi:MAG TPA: 16S rRNA (adenine(1518)-N(6)/adenine(1519)-N(6))-dimethyltransferase RsmA [Blastocatellia bacterium]|nr:16S rRNA (adenine(1518)-N(6)/adenine(1519)-N(6))-dimethyltransferase RsmA [Blastocatellia bacterium]
MITAKKSLGQNFLVDSRVASRIIDAVSPLSTDIVIEVGPGRGELTRALVGRSGYVVAVEIDRRLIDGLRSSLPREKFAIVEADALKVTWSELAELAEVEVDRFQGPLLPGSSKRRVRVVANLPYYISTPIIERLIRARRIVYDMTLMLQNEVADRITSEPGRKEYGSLSVLVQCYCIATKLFEVPPSAFKPAPKVRSAVVRLVVRERAAVDVDDEDKFFALVRAAFAQRRKTIANNLKAFEGAIGLSTSIDVALERARIDARRRAETLSIEEFNGLYRALYFE